MATSASSGVACSPFTFTANEAITEYRFVDAGGTTAAQSLKCSIADTGDKPLGIAQATADSGAPVAVAIYGVALLEVDGSGTAIAAGDYLKPDASSTGKGIKTVTDTDAYGAIALEPSTADGDVIRVLVTLGTVAG